MYVKEAKSGNKEYAFKMFGSFSELKDIEADKNNDKIKSDINDIKKELKETLLNKEFNEPKIDSYLKRFGKSQVFEVEKLLLHIKEKIKEKRMYQILCMG